MIERFGSSVAGSGYARTHDQTRGLTMYTRCFSAILLALLALAPSLRAQETHLVAYAGFAGFQAPVWAPKDLGLFTKYGFNGNVVFGAGFVRQIQAIVGGSIHFRPSRCRHRRQCDQSGIRISS